MMRPPAKRRKSVNLIPRDLPLEEDGSIKFLEITSLDAEASRRLLADVEAAKTGIRPRNRFRGDVDSPAGRKRFIKWTRECSVYVAAQLLQANLDQFWLAAARRALPSARKKAAEKKSKTAGIALQDYRRAAKETASQKQLAHKLDISQPTLRKLQRALGVATPRK